MIFGKHIDKIAEPVRTLPKLLGRKLAKATAATALICQHVASLLLVRAGILPAACLLSLASLPFETRAAVRILLTEEPPAEKPSSGVSYRGSMLPFVPAKGVAALVRRGRGLAGRRLRLLVHARARGRGDSCVIIV